MKNFVVIGGSSGIGKATVDLLKNSEMNVFSTFNTNTCNDSDFVKYFKCDILNDTIDFVNDLPEEIHGLAYCPGSINLKPFHRFTDDEFIDDFKLQVIGATKIIKALLPRLKKSRNASIVLFSTIAVQYGFKFHSQVSISKGAIEGLTKALSAELAPFIRVNAIAPSLTDTGLANKFLNTEEKVSLQSKNNPLKRIGNVEDIAEAAIYLLTEKSSWVTGQIIHVDGGYSTIK